MNIKVYPERHMKDKWLMREYIKGISDISEFFSINTKRSYSLVVVSDPDELNSTFGNKAGFNVLGACGRTSKTVYLLDKKEFKKILGDRYSKEKYSETLRHELAHSIMMNITDKTTPVWFFEGIAVYLSGQTKMMRKPRKYSIFLEYYNKHGKELYGEAGFAVDFLVRRYGKARLNDLIKNVGNGSKKEFVAAFKRVYGFEPNYDKFNEA